MGFVLQSKTCGSNSTSSVYSLLWHFLRNITYFQTVFSIKTLSQITFLYKNPVNGKMVLKEAKSQYFQIGGHPTFYLPFFYDMLHFEVNVEVRSTALISFLLCLVVIYCGNQCNLCRLVNSKVVCNFLSLLLFQLHYSRMFNTTFDSCHLPVGVNIFTSELMLSWMFLFCWYLDCLESSCCVVVKSLEGLRVHVKQAEPCVKHAPSLFEGVSRS